MNCQNCYRQFNHQSNVPRLLTLCGHSFCEACCFKMHCNSRIQCPQCHSYTYVEAVALLPKNLALLTVGQSHDSGNTCPKHNKKYQAFCEKQKVLICVDCILSDGYRKNPMESIKNAYVKQYQKLNKNLIKLNVAYQSLNEKLNQNQLNMKESKENYLSSENTIISIFKDIKQIVQIEEQQLLTKCQENYYASEKKFNQRNLKWSKNIEKLQQCLQNIKTSQSQPQLVFLQTTNARDSLISSVPMEIEDPIKPLSINFNKSTITQSLIRTLQKSIKIINQNQSKKAMDINITGKVIKKITNTTNNINNKDINNPSNKSNFKKNKKQTNPTQNLPSNNHQRNLSQNNILQKYDLNSKCDLSAVQLKDSLMSSFLSSMTCLVNQKAIHIIGGLSEDSNNVIKLNINDYSWEQVSLLSSNRSKFGAVAIDKDIFIFGGKKGKERVADGQIYNGNWKSGFSMSKVRSGFGLIYVSHYLYFIGGNDGEDILSTVECFDLQTCQWQKRESMHEVRDELSVVLGNDGKIYAIGGFGGSNNEPLNSVQVYDRMTDRWTSAPSLNYPRRALAAATLADGIYAIGGFDGSLYMSSVEKYEEGSKGWVMMASMNQARCTHSAVSISQSQEIYVFGGFDYIALDTVQKFNVVTNEWEAICRMPSPRFMHCSILVRE